MILWWELILIRKAAEVALAALAAMAVFQQIRVIGMAMGVEEVAVETERMAGGVAMEEMEATSK